MKPQKLNKKLSLNKSTVASLNSSEMGHLLGGCYTQVYSGCPLTYTCFITCGKTCNPTCNQATCATYTGNPQSDPCCETC